MTNTNKNTKIVKAEAKNITEVVGSKINTMLSAKELFLPENYSPENALKSAWLELQHCEDRNHNAALEICTTASVANALLDMVVQGLTPQKKQCYFVVYGRELTLMRSYMGSIAVAKRFSDVKDVWANVIYEGDAFKYSIDPQTGLKKIVEHTQDFGNIDLNKITGAYAVLTRESGETYVEIMTIDQIRKAWGQGAAGGKSPAHTKFPDEMAKKTVINRACKLFINTSDDSPVLVEAFNRSSEREYEYTNRIHDADADVIDVADEELTTSAEAAIFGQPDEVQPEKEEPVESKEETDTAPEEDGEKELFTEEEKAEIEAAEAAEAEAEMMMEQMEMDGEADATAADKR